MRLRKTGFTLVELMTVTTIIALLVTILMPGLANAIESARQTKCAANMKAIGTTIMGSCSNGALTKTRSKSGFSWHEETDAAEPHLTGIGRHADVFQLSGIAIPVTVNYYATIHFLDVHPSHFLCPSDGNAAFDDQTRDISGDKYWDFESNDNISYSVQAPITTSGAASNNPLSNCDAQVVVLGDRTPFSTLTGTTGQPGDSLSINTGPKWSLHNSNYQNDDSKNALSENHRGKAFIGLRFGGDLASDWRTDIGYQRDCVYTPSGEQAFGLNGTVWSDTTFSHTLGNSFNISQHFSRKDTFLIDTAD